MQKNQLKYIGMSIITLPLLNIVKTRIFYPVYNFIFLNLALFHLPAVRPSSTSAMACERGVNVDAMAAMSMWGVDAMAREVSRVERGVVTGVSIDCNGFQLCHAKTATCTHEHNYEIRQIRPYL